MQGVLDLKRHLRLQDVPRLLLFPSITAALLLFSVNCRHIWQRNEPAAAPWGRYASPEDVRELRFPAKYETEGKSYLIRFKTPKINHLTGGISIIIEFLDELVRMGYTGDENRVIKARDEARRYLRDSLLPAWAVNDTWGRHYWDWEAPVQTLTAMDTAARCFMRNPEYFPNWLNDTGGEAILQGLELLPEVPAGMGP